MPSLNQRDGEDAAIRPTGRQLNTRLVAATPAGYNPCMPGFERHVFICCNRRADGHPRGCCADKQSAAIRAAFKAALVARGLKGRFRANEAGCLDQCEHGPTVVVYPGGTWYGFVTADDVEEIVESHLVGGKPVGRLVLPDACLNTPACPHRPSRQ